MDVMLDIETLGTQPGCVVLEIGAVVFDPNFAPDRLDGANPRSWSPAAEFHCVLTTGSQRQRGLIIDGDTLCWWMENAERQRRLGELLSDPGAVHDASAMTQLATFLNDHQPDRLWTRGNFDLAILEHLAQACGMPQLWPDFRRWRDLRSDVFGKWHQFAPLGVALRSARLVGERAAVVQQDVHAESDSDEDIDQVEDSVRVRLRHRLVDVVRDMAREENVAPSQLLDDARSALGIEAHPLPKPEPVQPGDAMRVAEPRKHDLVPPPPADPSPEDAISPEFAAVWSVVRTWSVGAPWHPGYCGATGNHVMAILQAMRGADLIGGERVHRADRGSLWMRGAVHVRDLTSRDAWDKIANLAVPNDLAVTPQELLHRLEALLSVAVQRGISFVDDPRSNAWHAEHALGLVRAAIMHLSAESAFRSAAVVSATMRAFSDRACRIRRRHLKQGGTYGVLHDAVEVRAAGKIREGDLLVVYASEATGKPYARPVAEFNDGRFKEI